MLPTIADVAAALDQGPHRGQRAVLEELATTLLRIGIVRWEISQLSALLCRLTLGERGSGGAEDRRDAAAA